MKKRNLEITEMQAVKGGAVSPFWTGLLEPQRPSLVADAVQQIKNPFICIYTTKQDDVDQVR